ncbi:MAG: cysteine desulfurase [Acidobacteriota bacterium]|nr:cysteine desulfurase [Acidobacteriota bacterium]
MLYFDHNATTPIASEVADAIAVALRDAWGNPSSTHAAGQTARRWLENSRRRVAAFLGAAAPEIVFTSGGTESNNLAILGLVRNCLGPRKHVVTTAIEHPSVLEPCRQLEREGVEVTYLGVQPDGVVNPGEIARSVREGTVLVSVMHANNETGTIQPVGDIAALIHERRRAGQGIYFHSDGVQALGKIDVDVRHLGVDLYSVSAHKLYAPKGTGALFVSKGTPLKALQFGGRHERERRAGTENVVGAIAFARALEIPGERCFRDQFEERVLTALPDAYVNASTASRLPNTSSITFPGVSGESMVIALDMKGMAVSSGSACSSGSTEPSHVLLAMGLSRDAARSSVRFSFGHGNTRQDTEALADAVIAVAAKLRKPVLKENRLVQA